MNDIIIIAIVILIAFLCFWYGWRNATINCSNNTDKLIEQNEQIINNQKRIIELLKKQTDNGNKNA